MARTAKDITEAELAVLQVLWERGASSVRAIADALSTPEAPMQPATVQKLLERLEQKGWVARDRSEAVQRFVPLGDRDDLIGRRLEGIAEQLCEGSMTPLLSHLVRKERLSAEAIEQLRQLIDSLDPKGPRRKRQAP